MWSDLLTVKDIYLQGRGIKAGKGELTSFWLDSWLYDEPLSSCAPILFELCDNKNVTVAQVRNGFNITFRRWLFEELRICWDKICFDMSVFQFTDILDLVIWKLEKVHFLSKLYTMVYLDLRLKFIIKEFGKVGVGAESGQHVNIYSFAVRCDRRWPSTQ